MAEDTPLGQLIWHDFTGGMWTLFDASRPAGARPYEYGGLARAEASVPALELLKVALVSAQRAADEEIDRQGVEARASLLCGRRHPYDGGLSPCDRAREHDGKHTWEMDRG